MVSLSKVADKSSNTSADRSPESMASRISIRSSAKVLNV